MSQSPPTSSSPPPPPPPPPPPLIDISRPRTDQSTYWGRVRHFLDVIDPTTLFVTEKQLNHSLSILEKYKHGLLRDIKEEELWKAKKIKDAVVHPDTGEVIFWPCRWSAFVPINVPIVVGMLNSSTVYGNLFWQWANQSYNVAVNYANRNASNTMSMEQIGSAYAGAVVASCSIAIGLGKVVENISAASFTGKVLKLAIPFLAVSSAGALNVYLMRRNEISEGIAVQDHEGRTLGKSQVAGKQAILETALTRVALPAPILLFPPIIMNLWDKTSIAKQYPRIRTPMNVAVITGCLWAALPAAIGLFQQTSELDVKQMEPQFSHLKDSQGKPIDRVYFNKGL